MSATVVRTLKSAHAAVIKIVAGEPYVLLVQRQDNGAWEIPGGGPEKDETCPIAVSTRELREETGIEADGQCLVLREVESAKYAGSYYGVAVVILAPGASPRMVLQPSEVRDARWHLLSEGGNLVAFQARAFLPVVREVVHQICSNEPAL